MHSSQGKNRWVRRWRYEMASTSRPGIWKRTSPLQPRGFLWTQPPWVHGRVHTEGPSRSRCGTMRHAETAVLCGSRILRHRASRTRDMFGCSSSGAQIPPPRLSFV
jgi:hypothetical protein